MTSVLLAFIVARQDGLDTKIDHLSVTARPLSEVASQLSAASGEVILVAGQLAKEPVFVDLHGTTVRSAMDRLADSAYGEWSSKNGSYTLLQSDSASAASSKARSRRLATLTQSVKRVQVELAKAGWNPDSAGRLVKEIDEARQQFRDSFQVPEGMRPQINVSGTKISSPLDMVVAEAVAAVSAEMLDAIPEGRRVVYSTRPNRLQRPLNQNLNRSVAQFVKANAEIYDAAKSGIHADYGADWVGSLAYPSVRNLNVGKVNLAVQNRKGHYAAEVQLIGANGEDLGTKSVSFDSVPVDAPESADGEHRDDIELGPASLEFMRLQSNTVSRRSMSMAMRGPTGLIRVDAGQAPASSRPSAALRPFLDRPSKNDFLGLLIPEVIENRLAGKDSVVLIPDSLWALLAGLPTAEKLDSSRVAGFMADALEQIEFEGVAVWRPLDPLGAISTRMDRMQMQLLTDKVRTAGVGHMKDLAGYLASRSSDLGDVDADAKLFTVSMPFEMATMANESMNKDLALILAAGPDYASGEFDEVTNLFYSKMSSAQRSAFERMVLSRTDFLMGMGSDSVGISVRSSDEDMPAQTLTQEPTERFQNGFPQDAGITLRMHRSEGVLARLNGDVSGRFMSPEQLGAITGFIEGSGGANGEFKVAEFNEFQLADVRQFECSASGGLSFDFTDGRVVNGARWLSANQLPASLLKQGAQAREEMRKAAEEMAQRRQADPPPCR